MKKNYGLTNTEMQIMEKFWEENKRFSYRELSEYMNGTLDKKWKKQTLSTYLTNLQKMGLIEVDDSGKNYIYYATCTKKEVVQKWTRKLVKISFNNSIFNFVSAFTGGQKLTREEAEELKELFHSEDK